MALPQLDTDGPLETLAPAEVLGHVIADHLTHELRRGVLIREDQVKVLEVVLGQDLA